MKFYDLQVHTNASPCSRADPGDIVSASIAAGLDGIAITNHDTLDGYSEVAKLAPDELEIIPGAEVTTSQGHLLALGIERVPSHNDPLAVIDSVHEQGGVAILSHPFDRFRENFRNQPAVLAESVDGVETINSRCVLSWFNKQAQDYATQHDIAVTGGSDAHFPVEVGRARTGCTGAILESIRSGETIVEGSGGYISGHIATKLSDFASVCGL